MKRNAATPAIPEWINSRHNPEPDAVEIHVTEYSLAMRTYCGKSHYRGHVVLWINPYLKKKSLADEGPQRLK